MIDLEKLREKTQECYGVVMISESEFTALLDYAAQLEKDAGRYKWLRNDRVAGDWSKLCGTSTGLLYDDQLDLAIDTAMEASNAKAD